MKNLLFVFSFCMAFNISSLLAEGKYKVEVKGEYESWASGIGGQSTALLYGAGLGYYQSEMFYGASFVMGEYDMGSSSGKDLSRRDIDLIGGYKLDSMWSIFGGYRLSQMSYTNVMGTSDFNENIHGLGGGVAMRKIINSRWFGFASVALSLLKTETKYTGSVPSDPGAGYSFSVEGGSLYRFNQSNNLALNVKYQTNRISYDNSGVDWPHSYMRFGLSLNHIL